MVEHLLPPNPSNETEKMAHRVIVCLHHRRLIAVEHSYSLHNYYAKNLVIYWTQVIKSYVLAFDESDYVTCLLTMSLLPIVSHGT